MPQAAGGEAADDRRPQGDQLCTRGLLQHLAARSRPLAYLGSIRKEGIKTGSTRLRVASSVTKDHVRELKSPRCHTRMSQERRVRYAADYRALAG
jgi:hypothetical protein